MRFQDNFTNTSARYDVIRNGVAITNLIARGSPTVKMIGDAKVKMTLSGQFILDASVNFLTDFIRPYLILDGVEYPLGEYRVATQSIVHNSGVDYIDLEAYDHGLRIKQQTTETVISLAANNKYTDIVQAMLIDAGIEKIICVDSDAVLTTTREDWEIGTAYVDIINALLAEINYKDIYWDLDGNARVEPDAQATAANIAHTYESGEYSIIKPDTETTVDTFASYNVFTAIVSNADLDTPMLATAVNDNVDSPISTVNRGHIPAPPVKLDNIASQEALQEYVDNLRYQSMLMTETSTFETAKAPVHGVGDTIALNHESLQGIYTELEWSITMSATGQMTHKAKKVIYA